MINDKAISDKNTRVKHKRGKNKSHFCIYTPLQYTKEIVNISLNHYFSLGSDYKEILIKKDNNDNKKKINIIKEKLEKLRAIDLSCGDGNLLITLLEELIKISKIVYGEYRFVSSWISGYDIDNEGINILKTRVLEILEKFKLKDDLRGSIESLNFKNIDSLKVFDESYNIILGNPPYFGEKNHKEIFDIIKKSDFGKKYYEAKMDYFYFFIEKGIELLEKDGVLTYITTNYWLRADSGKKLRVCIKENTNLYYLNNINKSVFENAPGQHNMIFSLKKEDFKNNEVKIISSCNNFTINSKNLYDEEGKIVLSDQKEYEFSKKLLGNKSFFLEDKFNINQGIVSGLDKAFVFSNWIEDYKEYLKPFYKNKDINKYSIEEKNKFWILYLNKNSNLSSILEEHLRVHYEKLCKRREVRNGVRNWWELIWPREEKIFKEPSIVVRQRCKTNVFAYSCSNFYGSADIYYITPKSGLNEDKEELLFYTLGYLNSEIFYKWYKVNGKSKGPNMEFYSKPLQKTPIVFVEDKKILKNIVNLVKEQILQYSDEREIILNDYYNNIIEK